MLENALDAQAAHASIVLHTSARELLVERGRIAGVTWQNDSGSGVARAAVVVNAAGPWVDAVLGAHGNQKLIGGTRGSHLIVAPFNGAPAHAIYAEAGSDGRPFFIIPWNGLYLIGTTDERYTGDPGAAAMTSSEFDYLISETQRLFPAAADLADRVCYTYAGIRPLPNVASGSTAAITRRHQVMPHPGIAGLYSIIGGKLTTHRALAEDCLGKLRPLLPQTGPSPTRERPLPGTLDADDRDALLEELEARFGALTAQRLWQTYGGFSRQILAAADDADLAQRVGPGCEMLVAELAHTFGNEAAGSLIDCLQRRCMLGLDVDFGRKLAPVAADWLIRLGIRDKVQAQQELADYAAFARRFTQHSAAVDGLEA